MERWKHPVTPHRRNVARAGAILTVALVCMAGCRARSASSEPSALGLERTIPLPQVVGRIDHLAYDARRGRVFVAELGNGTVEGVDLATGRVIGRIGGLKEPQGLAFLPGRDELAVASGGDGSVRFYRGADLAASGAMQIGADADNLRIDPTSGRLVVGYGSGVLGVIDPAARRLTAAIPLPAHPEGFQLDDERAYVNLPEAGQIAVVHLSTGRVLASWRNPGPKWNFPLAIDPKTGEVAVVYRLPGRLVIWNAASGQVRQTLSACGDADDLFFDKPRARLYVICGQGAVDVFASTPNGYTRMARVPTRSGARTGLFVPSLDRLFVAARASSGAEAALLVFRPQP